MVEADPILDTQESGDNELPVTVVEERLSKLTVGGVIPETRYQIVRWLG